MEMKQMVYVVIENGYVTGVWNEYQDAASHRGKDGNIIPAVVDTYGERAACETPEEVIESMEQELQNLGAPHQEEDEEEDEEEEDDDDMFASFFVDDDEDEEEEEDNEESKFTDSDIIRRFLDLFYELLYN